MGLQSTSPDSRTGWLPAILFNGLLILMPLLAARIVTTAFSEQGFTSTPAAEAIAETRSSIDLMFKALPPSNADRRSYWADLVDRELRAKDMSAARGFLLAGPQLLEPSGAKALKAAAEAEVTGSEDERVARAATYFLPNDVRARYERSTRPIALSLMPEPAPAEPLEDDTETETEDAADTPAVEAASAPAPRPARATRGPMQFSVLGDAADLADLSERWLDNDSMDAFIVQITALGLLADDVVESSVDLTLAASILKAAERANRLHPSYESLLAQRLDAIFPQESLRADLEGSLGGIVPRPEKGARVLAIFRQNLNTEALPRLEEELEQINRIAELTSPIAATYLIEPCRHSEDIRKARLVAEAGGHRATSLAKQLGPRVLGLAQTGITWSRLLVLQIMGLAALGMLLLWMMVVAAFKAFAKTEPLPAALI